MLTTMVLINNTEFVLEHMKFRLKALGFFFSACLFTVYGFLFTFAS